MSARRMGRNPFEQRKAPAAPAAPAAAATEAPAVAVAEAIAAATEGPGFEGVPTARPATMLGRAIEWALVDVPAGAVIQVIRGISWFRG